MVNVSLSNGMETPREWKVFCGSFNHIWPRQHGVYFHSLYEIGDQPVGIKLEKCSCNQREKKILIFHCGGITPNSVGQTLKIDNPIPFMVPQEFNHDIIQIINLM